MDRTWKSVGDEDGDTDRMKIPGGKLYRTRVCGNDSDVVAVAMVFVPDPERTHRITLRKVPHRPSRS